MSVRLFALTCGWLTGPAGGFLAGATGRLRVPVPAFLIEHPRGKVLFDSGLHPDAGRDPDARLGPAAHVFEVELRDGEDVAARLGALGVDPAEIRYLITSHLHFDHTGGNASIPNARVVVQRREWDAGHDGDLMARNFYDARNYDTGHEVFAVDGEHDLFGDGRVVCLPTYGHTPGHQSLRVHLAGGDAVLTADACYLRCTLEELHLPAIVHDPPAMLASLHRLLRAPAGRSPHLLRPRPRLLGDGAAGAGRGLDPPPAAAKPRPAKLALPRRSRAAWGSAPRA